MQKNKNTVISIANLSQSAIKLWRRALKFFINPRNVTIFVHSDRFSEKDTSCRSPYGNRKDPLPTWQVNERQRNETFIKQEYRENVFFPFSVETKFLNLLRS